MASHQHKASATATADAHEAGFNRLKQWRDLATRYAKRASLYRSSLVLIAAIIWLR